MNEIASLFALESARLLREVHLPRIGRALGELRPADVWWRPHERATSAGNLLLHLEGNVRQWILSGLGGEADQRERASEFTERQEGPAGPLYERLERTVGAAAARIEGLPVGRWCEPVRIQGFDTTCLGAVYHVVEHFSWHTGQIVWIAKERGGLDHGLQLYDEERINRARNA